MINYLPYIFCGLLLIGVIYFILSSRTKKVDDKKDDKKEEKKDPVYEKAVKFLNFKITSIETYAEGGNVQSQPADVIKTIPSTPSPEELKRQNEEALKRQIEEEKRVYSKFTKEQMDQILRDILISPTPLKIGSQEVPSLRIIFKEMLGGKDPYVCYKTIPQGIENANKVNDLMMTDPLIKALKESNSTYLGIMALFKYKLFSLLLPPDMMTFAYNEKDKTFRLSFQGKPITLAELTSPSLRELSLNTTPNFLPFNEEQEKTRLLPQSIKLIQTAREYYNNHPDIALRLQSYKTNNTLDIPLQAVEDSNILTLSNMYLNNPQLNQFNMRCDLPYDF